MTPQIVVKIKLMMQEIQNVSNHSSQKISKLMVSTKLIMQLMQAIFKTTTFIKIECQIKYQ